MLLPFLTFDRFFFLFEKVFSFPCSEKSTLTAVKLKNKREEEKKKLSLWSKEMAALSEG